jgi:glycine cleavage system H protein
MALRQFARQSARSLGLRSDVSAFAPAVATRGMSTVIEGLKYMASHEWAKVDGDTVTVGITDHAQAELGDVVYVELPEVGSTVEAKSTFGVVESVKAASDVYSPISGEVVAVNEELADSPGAVERGRVHRRVDDEGEDVQPRRPRRAHGRQGVRGILRQLIRFASNSRRSSPDPRARAFGGGEDHRVVRV